MILSKAGKLSLGGFEKLARLGRNFAARHI
jgi:hypothetical protein